MNTTKPNQAIKVRVMSGYAMIFQGDAHQSRLLDVRLHDGLPRGASLRKSATEMREQAAKLIARAELIEAAAILI